MDYITLGYCVEHPTDVVFELEMQICQDFKSKLVILFFFASWNQYALGVKISQMQDKTIQRIQTGSSPTVSYYNFCACVSITE